MRPLIFTWPYALPFWLVYMWAFAPEIRIGRDARKRVAASGSPKDAGSLRVILLGMWLGLMAAFPIAFLDFLRFPARLLAPAVWVGTALLAAGSLLRRHCFKLLGEWFTGDVQARADQPVIDRGAYRFVRHPSYTGGLIMFAGIGIALGHWISFVTLVAVAAGVYSYRVAIEERALSEAIGEPYLAFLRTRKRFVPGIW